MRRVRWARPALIVLCVVASGCYERQLSHDEIDELFSGATVSGSHTQDGYDFVRRYSSGRTFEQIEGPAGDGTWMVSGEQICITWNPPHPKTGRVFCRRVMTDDQGTYWKEFDKRNGDTVRIVEYKSFYDANGGDLRTIYSGLEFWTRWAKTWRGLVAGAALLLLFVVLLRALLKGKDDPTSTRNRLGRALWGVRVGSLSYRHSELKTLDSEKFRELLIACLRQEAWVEMTWAIEALFAPILKTGESLKLLWSCLGDVDDYTAQLALKAAEPSLDAPAANIEAVDGDVRFAYLMGRLHAEQAVANQQTSSTEFERHKQAALAYYQHVRNKGGTPPPPELVARASPYRESPYQQPQGPDYASLVGAAYETILYLNFIAPAKRSYSSSSYSGGG